jgi:acyl dehydratase
MGVRTFESPPGTAGLYLSALAAALPWRHSGRASEPPTADSLPEPIRVAGMTFEPSRLQRYRSLCGFAGEGLPATAPQVLALPLHLLVMTDPLFPFAPLGVVHIGNTITQRRPLTATDAFDLTVTCGPPIAHPRGQQLALRTEGVVAGELVWHAETVLLSRDASSSARQPAEPAATAATAATAASQPRQQGLPDRPPAGPQLWRLPSDLGRRYASISGDRNPIHLFDLTAKPFGFTRHIAHGMWTKARCLAELQNRLPGSFEVTVSFRKPVSLPSQVRFGARTDGSTSEFGVTSESGSAHLVGRVSPESPDGHP